MSVNLYVLKLFNYNDLLRWKFIYYFVQYSTIINIDNIYFSTKNNLYKMDIFKLFKPTTVSFILHQRYAQDENLR